MKITAGAFWLLLWYRVCSQIRRLVSAQERGNRSGGAQTQEERQCRQAAPEQTGAALPGATAGGGLYGLYPTARQAAG